MTTFDLRRLRLRPGEEHCERVEIALAPLELAGQRYVAVPESPDAELTIARASTGTVLGLRYDARLHGPCFRCLADAVLDVQVAAREYQATIPGDSEELRTPYLRENLLDLSAWGRDALVLELPDKILCRPDCAGLCAVCGRDLNHEPHEHDLEPAPSPWAALESLRTTLE